MSLMKHPTSGEWRHVCLGRKPKRVSVKTPALGDFLDRAILWPSVKPVGWEYAPPAGGLQMLANDRLGDCAEAGAYHFIQASTANTDNPLYGTEQQCIDLYSAVTGYDPNDPSTDQGTVLLDLLNYWKTIGIPCLDKNGNSVMHKILGYASLDLTSVAQMRWATVTFGGLYLGIKCPQSALQNTNNWTYDPTSPIEGGHCINGEGEGAAGGHIQSWALNIPFTWEFMLHLLDEGYEIVSEAWVNSVSGKSPSGLDLDGLLSALAKI